MLFSILLKVSLNDSTSPPCLATEISNLSTLSNRIFTAFLAVSTLRYISPSTKTVAMIQVITPQYSVNPATSLAHYHWLWITRIVLRGCASPLPPAAKDRQIE